MRGNPTCTECSPSQEADHRIANHLALLAGYVRLQAASIAKQPDEPNRISVGLSLKSVGIQIEAVAHLHRSLAVEQHQISSDLGEHLHEICTSFTSGFLGAVHLIENFAPGCRVRPEEVLPLTQIVAEVLVNAIKHTQADGDPVTIVANCTKDVEGALVIEIIDEGPGLPEGFDPETDGGLGFCLLRALAKKLDAQIAFRATRTGLCFQLTLPSASGKDWKNTRLRWPPVAKTNRGTASVQPQSEVSARISVL
ncbi:MAG: signal transduction histidine kinase [Rhodospirillales bacterium]|nr:signal transduction histidine kinase [Rhodospirillales bacterium]